MPRHAPPPPPLTLDEIEAVFFALAHEARRHIVMLLGHAGGELPSGYLAKRFGHSWPTTTRHLHVLEQAGLVEVRRRGRSAYYRLDRARVERVLGGWLAKLEPSTPKQTWTSTGPRSTAGTWARPSAPPKGGAVRSTRAPATAAAVPKTHTKGRTR